MSRSRASRTAIAAVGFAIASAATLSACSSDDATGNGKPTIVASTNVWGSVAAAVAGDDANVTSVIQDPSADPHSYESSPSDAAAVTDADLVVFNGGGYDEFIEKILGSAKDKPVVDAYELLGAGHSDSEGDAHNHAGAGDDHEGHDHGAVNEHVWYDIPTVDAVAHKIADELSKLDPDNAKNYTDRVDAFDTKLHAISDITAKIAVDHPKAPVAQTEPIAHYLLEAAGVEDLTPEEFESAIEEGSDPSPSAVAATRDLLVGKKVDALVYNIQTEDKVTQDLRANAESAGIRIVEVTETLPDGLDYIQWQTRNAEALAEALN
ncbi:metal ABC transporter solute-binding protein, Zn/Mn family [Antrihabitans sp. NCIMB 15449]|uniref:Metal ABC transporter solute-binding protein, Zn/Mn family n=1 Tax=Antrihabitans spumae TaxID=3373370 RepID=A0ABW7JMT1_9NOCA